MVFCGMNEKPFTECGGVATGRADEGICPYGMMFLASVGDGAHTVPSRHLGRMFHAMLFVVATLGRSVNAPTWVYQV